MEVQRKRNARFDARLTLKQKELFENAAQLAGYRSLTDFIISTAQKKAEEIISENNKIIASKKDAVIFFEALIHPDEPNEELKEAHQLYNSHFSK